MNIVILIFGAFLLGALIGLIYLLTRFHRFRPIKALAGKSRFLSWIAALVPVLLLVLLCVFDMINGVITVIHLFVFWIFCDIAGYFIRRHKGTKEIRHYYEGLAAILITAAYLGAGLYADFHVWETDYQLTAGKELGTDRLRIVQITDSHIGSTFGGEGFAKHMARIQETDPDVIVITGDYVDDGTEKEDMVRSCQALGDMKSTYGTFFVFGNHDKGYMNYRNFTAQELRRELEKNHVRILEDEAVLLNDSFYIIGRKDRSERYGRASMEELVSPLDPSRYMVVLDHQPHDFAAQAEAGVDLVLCGHTHGGQMFPVGILGEVSGANEKTYGLKTTGTTNYIVSSGISDWEIIFKTGTFSEFCVIDITRG